jgi:cyclophilin family peptidyl-prolyl cis-trans isomerase
MIQGGCPNGIGNGGPGYTIQCELTGDNQYHDRGVLVNGSCRTEHGWLAILYLP